MGAIPAYRSAGGSRRPGRLARKRDRLRKHNQSQNELKRNSGQLTFYKNMRYAYVPMLECVILKPFYKRWKNFSLIKKFVSWLYVIRKVEWLHSLFSRGAIWGLAAFGLFAGGLRAVRLLHLRACSGSSIHKRFCDSQWKIFPPFN